MFLQVWMLAISLFSYGCGSGSSGGDDTTGPRGVREGGLGTPVSLSLQDPTCQKSSTALVLQDGPIDRSYTGEGLYQGLELKIFKKHFSLLIEAKDQSNISDIRVCRDRSGVRADTVEGATIKVLDDVKAANQFYRKTAENGSSTTPLSLNMFPLYEQYVKVEVDPDFVEEGQPSEIEQGGYVTDNAAWTYSTDENGVDRYSMIFFPKSKELAKKGWFNGKGLWEVPFVARHEFGHHVFSEYMKNTDAFSSLSSWYRKKNSYLPLGTISGNGAIERSMLLARMGTSSQREAMWVAINEGFADLFAYLSMGGNDQLADFSCFSKNRQLSEGKFHDGRYKSVTDLVLNEFFTEEESSNPLALAVEEEASCQSYSLRDPHIIGAMIAHGILKILSDDDDLEELSVRTFKWISSLKDYGANYSQKDGSELLSYVVSKAVAVVSQEDDSAATLIKLTDKVNKYFPFSGGMKEIRNSN